MYLLGARGPLLPTRLLNIDFEGKNLHFEDFFIIFIYIASLSES